MIDVVGRHGIALMHGRDVQAALASLSHTFGDGRISVSRLRPGKPKGAKPGTYKIRTSQDRPDGRNFLIDFVTPDCVVEARLWLKNQHIKETDHA